MVYQVVKPLLLVWDGPRRVWVVPGGDTRVVSGFQPPRLFVGIDLGVFPEREVCLLKVPRVPIG